MPDIRHLDSEMIEVCAALIAAVDGWIPLYELFELLPLEVDAFLFFTVDQLARTLLLDGRFEVVFEEKPLVYLKSLLVRPPTDQAEAPRAG